MNKLFTSLTLLFLFSFSAFAEEPPLPTGLSSSPALPMGLETSSEPSLPTGLESEEPELPFGLDKEGEEDFFDEDFEEPWIDFSGFIEGRGGFRTREVPFEKDASIAETRLQTSLEKSFEKISFKLTADFLYDDVLDDGKIKLEDGKGWIDLREANILLRPTNTVDIKFGRQILTWGVGDLLFINDLFPKDWNSFFIGRDDEYLKAPSDAIKTSLFTSFVNIDFAYTPKFDSDRYIDGRRISFHNSGLGRISGDDFPVKVSKPDDWFRDDEWALRIYRNIGNWEMALYGYYGFWKSPGGSDFTTGKALFPDLGVYGASARGPMFKGIGSFEIGYYDSLDNQAGKDPAIKNSEYRFLASYEREIARDLTATFQYYLEYMDDYGEYKNNLPNGIPRGDEDRHLFTLRLTKLLLNQNLMASLFTYYSPSDEDAYLRPKVNYKVTDNIAIETGGNIFLGDNNHTFFAQFKENTNLFGAVRYSF